MNTILILIFYIATNAIPGNVDKFQMQAQNEDQKNIQMDFIRQKDGIWKVLPEKDMNDIVYFKFDDQFNLYFRTVQQNTMEKIDLKSKVKIKKNKRKWKKATEVNMTLTENDKQTNIDFKIKRKGKKQFLLEIDAPINSKFRGIPPIKFTWK